MPNSKTDPDRIPRQPTGLRVSAEMKRQIVEVAAADGESIATTMRRLIKRGLDEHARRRGPEAA